MPVTSSASLLVTFLLTVSTAFAVPAPSVQSLIARESPSTLEPRWGKITPKVLIISMFAPERAVWVEPLKLSAHNISIPGLSPLFPEVGCNKNRDICIVTTGESEINAAATTTALFLSSKFNFKKTYFLIAGIAGINPYMGTLGSVTVARFAVQVALQYELDPRQMPANWTGGGYWAFGTSGPGIRPAVGDLYGTEVFEVSVPLLNRVLDLTKNVKLNDSATAIAYRKQFDYAPANLPPAVVQCDVATSDVYYAGNILSEAFGNFTALMTNGTGKYCSTAQEDNATLESLVRSTKAGLTDYSRVIILRSGSDFERAPPPSANLTAYAAFKADQGGFVPALENLYQAGWPVIKEIVYDWQAWEAGDHTQSLANGSYYGDDLGTLRGGNPQA